MQPTGTRRWPPIVAMVVAATMVFLVLPNPLRIPQNNPTAAAEYAPVPGKTQNNADANFGETGIADSAGIGSGGAGEGLLPGSPLPPPPPQFKPRQKNCVGNPPRQTEDQLSPPCVPFFDADNGGETYTGVSKDRIVIALYNDLGVEGDMNTPWKPSEEAAGHQASQNGQQTYLRRTIKALLRHFQSRYQTYGRTVHVIAQDSQGGLSTPCSGRQGDAAKTRLNINPFAVVHFGDGGQCYMQYAAEKFKIPSFGLNSDVPRAAYEGYRPYVWGFFPDQESEAQWSAGFICKKLHGQTAKFTDDPTLKGKPRKFGLAYPSKSQRGPESAELAQLLLANLKQQCGMQVNKDIFVETFVDAGSAEAPNIMNKWKREGVTTVICYCVPVQTENTVTKMQSAAKGIGYLPEWYWDHASRMFRAIWNQLFGDDTMKSFGVNHHWRGKAFREQIWYQAYLEQEPETVPNTRFGFDIYHLFLNLFQAIQAAGPNLTPETVERGMFTFNYLNRDNPFVPVGGYGQYNNQAVGSYTFIDTAMGWWWDPTGTPPDGQSGEGCLRLENEGKRYYWNEWPEGDADLFVAGAPCNQDDTEIADPKPGDF
jgi:hypothetical protein